MNARGMKLPVRIIIFHELELIINHLCKSGLDPIDCKSSSNLLESKCISDVLPVQTTMKVNLQNLSKSFKTLHLLV